MMMIRWAHRVAASLGIDPAVAAVLFGNIGIGLLSLVQVALITSRLTEAEQGVNFTFLAFFSIILLFDLGFGLVIQQLVSHQRAFLEESPDGVLSGPAAHHTRMAALLHLLVRWYGAVFLLAIAVMLPIGFVFYRQMRELDSVDWQIAWILTVVTAAGVVIANGFTKFLSGCGDVLAVARVTPLQLMAASLGFCVVMGLGGKLYAFSGSQACFLAVTLVWLSSMRRPLLANLWRTAGDGQLNWYRSVRPFQSRIALSQISVQANLLLVPVAARCFGADSAGRLGMSLAVIGSLQALGIYWVETRVPIFGQLIAKRNWPELDRIYHHVWWKSTTFLAAILAILVAANVLLNQWQHPQVQAIMCRFLAPAPTILLAMVTLANHIFYVRAAYLRAHCKEPYLMVTVLQALALLATMALAGRYGTMDTLLGGCLFWTLILGQGLGGWIFRVKRREWHSPVG